LSTTRKRARGPLSRQILLLAASICALNWGAAANAVTVIPEKGGLSGYVNLGVGGVEIESNLLSEVADGLVEVGDAIIDDINSSPDSETAAVPMLNFELSYTFEGSRTQLYIGNLLEDFLTFDLSAQGGIRQDVGGVGVFGIAFLSTSLSADVWQDPYQSGVKRKEKKATCSPLSSSGVHRWLNLRIPSMTMI